MELSSLIFHLDSYLASSQYLNYLELLSPNINSCCLISKGILQLITSPYLIFLIITILYFYLSSQLFSPMYLIFFSIDSFYYLKEIMIFQNELPYLLQLNSFQPFQFSKPLFPHLLILFMVDKTVISHTSYSSGAMTLTPYNLSTTLDSFCPLIISSVFVIPNFSSFSNSFLFFNISHSLFSSSVVM